MKKNRGKREVETHKSNNNYEENYLEFPCKKHPNSSTSPGGICAYCLTDRLYQIVCSQCGELSSTCSCTNIYSTNNPNSSSPSDVGHFARISFLLENDKANYKYYDNPKMDHHRTSNADDYATLRRCNSVSVGGGGGSGGGGVDFNSYGNTCTNTNINSNTGRKESKEKFWKIGRLFRKKKEKSNNYNNNDFENTNINTNSNECSGFPRSRSLSSFRGVNETEGESGNFPASTSAARASSVSYMDSAKMSCFSESEARFSNFDYMDSYGHNKNYNNNNNNNNVFMSCDDPGYIDLKLHNNNNNNNNNWSSTSTDRPSRVPDLGALRRSGLGMSTREFGYRGNTDHEMLRNSSCRRSSVTERELRKCRKSSKVMKWFFKHQSSTREHDDDDQHHHGFM